MFVGYITIWKLLKYPTTPEKMWIAQKKKQIKTKRQNHTLLNKILAGKKILKFIPFIFIYVTEALIWFIIFCFCSDSMMKAERKYGI